MEFGSGFDTDVFEILKKRVDKMSERGGVGGRGEHEIGKGADLDRGISTLFRTANGSTVRL